MTIQSDRLLYRSYRDDDFPFLCSMLADADTMKFIGNGKTRDRDRALEFLYWIYKSYEKEPDFGLRLLVRKEDGQRVGHAGLVPQTVENKEELEIGYWVAREFWGRGYATEAAAAFRNYGFQTLGKSRLISLIQQRNLGSRKVAERIGMCLEKEISLSGKDVCVYALENRIFPVTERISSTTEHISGFMERKDR